MKLTLFPLTVVALLGISPGSQAIAGENQIVSIESLTVTGSNSVTVETGTQQRRRGNLTLSAAGGQGASALLSLSTNQQRVSSLEDQQHRQALLKLAADAQNSEHRLLLNASATDRLACAEDSGGSLYALPREAEKRDSTHSLASWRSRISIVDNQDWTARMSWTRTEGQTDHPGISAGVIDGIPASLVESSYRKFDAEVYLNWRLSQNQSPVGGTSGYKANGENQGTLDFGFPVPVDFSLSQESYSAFAESSTSLNDVTLDIGVRFDAPRSFTDEVWSRVRLTLNLDNLLDRDFQQSVGFVDPGLLVRAGFRYRL